jgi:hypothetical protein
LIKKLEQPYGSEKLKLIGFGLPALAARRLVLEQALLYHPNKNGPFPVLGFSEHLTPFSAC